MYVATLEALRTKERQDETQFTTKIDGFMSLQITQICVKCKPHP
jgi:hypothetical protein